MSAAAKRSLALVLNRRMLLAASGAFGLAAGRWGRTAARQATPEASPAGGPLPDLLHLVPDPYPAATGNALPLVYFADVAAQLAAVGLTPPTDPASEDAHLWQQAIRGLVMPRDVLDLLSDPLWLETFGWSPYEITQSAEFGQPPQTTMLLRGAFDAAAVEAALLAIDFVPFAVEGAVAAFTVEHKELSFTDPIERVLKLSSLRNLAILPDGTFAWSEDSQQLRAVAATLAGSASLGELPEVASLLDAVTTPLVSAALLPGLALQGDPGLLAAFFEQMGTPGAMDATAMATAEAELRRMPAVGMALIGNTGGGETVDLQGTPVPYPLTPPPVTHAYLQFGGEAPAAEAAAVIEERLASGRSIRNEQPWSEIFTGWEVQPVPGRPVVHVTLTGAPPLLWLSLLAARDLGFFAW